MDTSSSGGSTGVFVAQDPGGTRVAVTASPEYCASLVVVMAKRALAQANG